MLELEVYINNKTHTKLILRATLLIQQKPLYYNEKDELLSATFEQSRERTRELTEQQQDWCCSLQSLQIMHRYSVPMPTRMR